MTKTLDRNTLETCRTAAMAAWTSVSVCRGSLQHLDDDEELHGLIGDLEACATRLSQFVSEQRPESAWQAHQSGAPSLAKLLGETTERRAADTPVVPEGQLQLHSSIFPVGEALQFLAFQRKTGTVLIKLEEERIRLEIIDGQLLCAVSDSTPDGQRLAEILVRQGTLEAAQVSELVEASRTADRRLGEWLLDQSVVTREQLLVALRHQIKHLFNRCLRAREAEISFYAHDREAVEELARVDLAEAVLDGMCL